jgi:hypothetical protein
MTAKLTHIYSLSNSLTTILSHSEHLTLPGSIHSERSGSSFQPLVSLELTLGGSLYPPKVVPI